MAWAFVQSAATGQGAGTSLSVTLNGITVGNRLMAWVYVYGAGITLSQVADSLGNGGATPGRYDQVLLQADPFNGKLYLLTVPVANGGNCTITATATGAAAFMSMSASEYSGLSTATGTGPGVVDTTAGANGTISPSMVVGPTALVSGPGELALTAHVDSVTGGSANISSPAGWTERGRNLVASTLPLIFDDQTPTAGATDSATWVANNTDAGNGWAEIIAVFKLAGVASSGPVGGVGATDPSGLAPQLLPGATPYSFMLWAPMPVGPPPPPPPAPPVVLPGPRFEFIFRDGRGIRFRLRDGRIIFKFRDGRGRLRERG